ncbi:MAG: TonB-dependent receptor [Bacteroidales bacterium]|nr:TonB-dependent receptor [Bacteroidales bacterium]
MKRIITAIAIGLLTVASAESYGQQQLTREQILAMSTEELSELPLEDLMQAVETLGVSSVDELFALIMNKNVSSASKKEEDTFTSPLSTTVITKSEMRTYGVSCIEEAMRLIPGMIVTEKTNGVYDIQMRGLNNIPDNNMILYSENSNTLVMIDGRPVHNYAMGAVNFDMIPIDIEDVDRIEVVRGTATALYGANAVTGVINIITEKPDMAKYTVTGSVQMGNQSTFLGNVALRKSMSDKLAMGLTVSVQHRNRPTDKLYVIPAAGVMMSKNKDAAVIESTDEASFGAMVATGELTDFSAGGYVSTEDLHGLRQIYKGTNPMTGGTYYSVFKCLEPETPASEMFPDPGLARSTEGYNGYIAITPAKDVRIDITGGYQRSYINSTPVGDDYFSFNGRQSKSGYAALSASIKDLKVLANYSAGPQDYAVGVSGFKVKTNVFNVSAEYDINVGELGIRPGISYQKVYYEDYVPEYTDKERYEWKYEDPGHKYDAKDLDHLSGFFNYDAELTALAPSLRLDYKHNNFRAIAAYRADKTNIPDKWNHSWQISLSQKLNDKNFIRLVYGRGYRSAIMVNSSANFEWTRTDLMFPDNLKFLNNKEADLVSIDNIELGYRMKPSQNLLLDAEVFYSISRDYGALMGNSAYVWIAMSDISKAIASRDLSSSISAFHTGAVIQYDNLPYEVKQMGLSLNMDWILSSKLIAKVNLNVQNTKIDKYYQYNQTNMLGKLLTNATMEGIMVAMRTSQAVNTAEAQAKQAALDAGASEAEAEAAGQTARTAAAKETFQEYIRMGLYDPETDRVTAGNQDRKKFEEMNEENYKLLHPDTEDGVENKATPKLYGMIGLMYRPMERLNISAFANYIGKRTYATKYNSNGEELGQRLTINLKVGFKPVQNFELFFNAHNLLNNKKREFVYSDEIKGIYTFGANFSF